MLTKDEFEDLTPYERGYAVYMLGNRDDQPNVPNESNPYEIDSKEYLEWERGQHMAVLHVMDGEE